MKFGVVITTEGMFLTHDLIVGFGISVIPGGRFLSTYSGGSPMYVPRTIPNIFPKSMFYMRILFNSGKCVKWSNAKYIQFRGKSMRELSGIATFFHGLPPFSCSSTNIFSCTCYDKVTGISVVKPNNCRFQCLAIVCTKFQVLSVKIF